MNTKVNLLFPTVKNSIDPPNHTKELELLNIIMISPNTIIHLAHVHVAGSDYNIALSMCTVSRNIHIFKYNEHCCAYEIFDNQLDACMWLEQPLQFPGYR